MRIAALLFLISLQASAISLEELYKSYNGFMTESQMPPLWRALGDTLKRFSTYTALKAALDTNAELDKRIDNLNNIYITIILPMMKFPTSEIMTWQILIHGEIQKLRSIPSAPLPRASSSGFDWMDDINDPSDSK